jgi:hypothetical protein
MRMRTWVERRGPMTKLVELVVNGNGVEARPTCLLPFLPYRMEVGEDAIPISRHRRPNMN